MYNLVITMRHQIVKESIMRKILMRTQTKMRTKREKIPTKK